MPYVPPESLRVRRHAQFVTVESPFWTVVHDTARGGVPVDIRFTHGLAGNVLREPLVSTVGERSDANDRDSRLRVRRKGPSIDIEFTGSLTGPGRRHADGIEYRALYEYTPYWVRRELRLRFP